MKIQKVTSDKKEYLDLLLLADRFGLLLMNGTFVLIWYFITVYCNALCFLI